LNLRRTVACVAHLAVSRFGSWAGISVLDGMYLRRADSTGADDFRPGSRPCRLSDQNVAAVLQQAATAPIVRPAPVDPEVLAALGVPAGSAELLAGGGGALITVPLLTTSPDDAVLAVVAGSAPPPAVLAELRTFAQRAARAMSAAAVYEERSTLARTLRTALAPAPLPAIPGVQLGAAYRPAQEASQIGGDFYDVIACGDRRWSLSIGDVCGKGVDAAVLTGQVRQSLRTAALVTDDPAQTLRLVNETLLGTDGSTFVTATYGVLQPGEGSMTVRLATGGHPPALLLRGGEVQAVSSQGTLIGMLDTAAFQTVELSLEPGDVLLFYTDGAPEARGPSGLLGTEPLVEALADCAGLTAQAVADRLMQLVMEHLHGWAHDDVALLAVRCTPEPSALTSTAQAAPDGAYRSPARRSATTRPGTP
jgi:serine phosphatase RsbU (regulator of sigma subunit)